MLEMQQMMPVKTAHMVASAPAIAILLHARMIASEAETMCPIRDLVHTPSSSTKQIACSKNACHLSANRQSLSR